MYELANRTSERVCMNRMSLMDAENIYTELQKMEDEKRLKEGVIKKIRHLQIRIDKITPIYVQVSVINRYKVKGGTYEINI